MNPSAWAFLLELEPVLNVLVGDSKQKMLFLRMVDFRDKKFLYLESVNNVRTFLILGNCEGFARAGDEAGDAAS